MAQPLSPFSDFRVYITKSKAGHYTATARLKTTGVRLAITRYAHGSVNAAKAELNQIMQRRYGLEVALALSSIVAHAQWNPTETAIPTITLYPNEAVSLSVQGFNPTGQYPFTLETPFKCTTVKWQFWDGLINSSVVWVSHTDTTVTVTGAAPGSTTIIGNYTVTDCFGNSVDLDAAITVNVVAAPGGQSIYGDSVIQYIPTGPVD